MHLLLAQFTADDVAREIARLQRNYEFLSYGLIVAWTVVVVYVLMMVARQKKLKREIASLKAMLEERQHR
jgi:CcmD family protein